MGRKVQALSAPLTSRRGIGPWARWVAEHRERIELFFLPAYAPEHSPDEFLHSDPKRSLGRRPAVRDKAGLESRLRGYLRRLQRQPETVRAFFQPPTTRYAA